VIALRILGGLTGLACVVPFVLWVAPAVAQTAPPAKVETSVLAHAVERGTLLSVDDFVVEERTPAQARGTLSASAATGKEAARNFVAGAVLRPADVLVPRLVRRGEPVTITVRSGGLAIATGGRALASGGQGELVRVVSLSTNRTLDGIVEGPSAVRVTAP
jgi:flagella basal body P-ring formation protein FlgA